MSQSTKLTGVSALTFVTALLLAASFFLHKSVLSLSFIVIAITGFQSILAFLGLGWALHRPGSAFYSIFVGDALLRLAGLGVVVYVLWATGAPFTSTLLLLGSAYFLFSVVQVPFFMKVR